MGGVETRRESLRSPRIIVRMAGDECVKCALLWRSSKVARQNVLRGALMPIKEHAKTRLCIVSGSETVTTQAFRTASAASACPLVMEKEEYHQHLAIAELE